jgi:ferredoxin-NADP reductase
MKKYTLTLSDIKYETKDTITLCFNQPRLRKIKYLAGQYITIELRINGRKYARPYSFSSFVIGTYLYLDKLFFYTVMLLTKCLL